MSGSAITVGVRSVQPALVVDRLPVRVGDGVIHAGDRRAVFTHGDPTSLLNGYLRLIRSLRRQEKAPSIALRRDDILQLAAYLDISGAELVDRLTALMGVTAAQRRTIASLFAAGAIVIGLTAATTVGAGGHVAHADGTPSAAAAGSSHVVTSVVTNSDPGVIRTAAGSPTLAPAVRLQVPDHPIVAPEVASEAPVPLPTPRPNASTCRSETATPAMTLVIPDVSYECSVYAGGQALIDAGFVTLVTEGVASKTLATRPGEPGTLWLAAHRSSHGGAFADVPTLADGATITVAAGATVATYRVVARAYVEVRNGLVVDASGHPSNAATVDSILRPDRGGNAAPRLLLQTCDGENFRWMIYADLVG